MIEILTGFFTGKILSYIGGTIGVLILGYILKKIPNEKISKKVDVVFYGLGWLLTGWANKKLPKVWEKALEPFVIDLIDNVLGAMVRGFIRGLKADNKNKPK